MSYQDFVPMESACYQVFSQAFSVAIWIYTILILNLYKLVKK